MAPGTFCLVFAMSINMKWGFIHYSSILVGPIYFAVFDIFAFCGIVFHRQTVLIDISYLCITAVLFFTIQVQRHCVFLLIVFVLVIKMLLMDIYSILLTFFWLNSCWFLQFIFFLVNSIKINLPCLFTEYSPVYKYCMLISCYLMLLLRDIK